jgi:DNA-binding IclR family transcriptional regulator
VYETVARLEPVEVRTIADAIGKGRDATRWQLDELARAGYLTKTGSGRLAGGMEILEYRTTGEKPPAS